MGGNGKGKGTGGSYPLSPPFWQSGRHKQYLNISTALFSRIWYLNANSFWAAAGIKQ